MTKSQLKNGQCKITYLIHNLRLILLIKEQIIGM
jgi:hypothetical protein